MLRKGVKIHTFLLHSVWILLDFKMLLGEFQSAQMQPDSIPRHILTEALVIVDILN